MFSGGTVTSIVTKQIAIFSIPNTGHFSNNRYERYSVYISATKLQQLEDRLTQFGKIRKRTVRMMLA